MNTLVAETPRHDVRLEEFHLMRYEVTNEQFAAYVAAAGARPPEIWGATALDAAPGIHRIRGALLHSSRSRA